MSDRVRLVQLYPQELGITGDRGNVRALRTRLEHAGVQTQFFPVGQGEALPDEPDVIVIGNGPLSAMRGVHADLTARAAALEQFVADGGALLAVGASAELLSEGVTLLDGEVLTGLGIFSFRVQRVRERRVGYLVVDTEAGRIVGFEDHASEWTLGTEAQVFGTAAEGKGSFVRGAGRGEIVTRENAYATNLQGPVLPLNPLLIDVILRGAAARRGEQWPLGDGSAALDGYAESARATIERLLHDKRFASIGV